MPLAFQSLSHGRVAFGFFNIDVDLLLLQNLFFWAEDFCRAVIALNDSPPESDFAHGLDGRIIVDPARLGELHGAMAGLNHDGFIGALYRRFPFPRDPEAFRQSPDGHRNRPPAADLLGQWAVSRRIVLSRPAGMDRTAIDDYVFDGPGFNDLIAYVDRGGLPRWRDERRPDYVTAMTAALSAGGRLGWPGTRPSAGV